MEFFKDTITVKKWLFYFCSVIFCILFFIYYFSFSTNFPYNNDDIYHLVGFLVKFDDKKTIIEKLSYLGYSIDGHKVIFPRLIYLFE